MGEGVPALPRRARRHPAARLTRALSSEVGAGSREENASKQESRAPFRFRRNGALAFRKARRKIALSQLRERN
ncbi:hypothetical protein XH93_00775 [Bradyrhizobium sp. CCBAU 51753]|nr:hypothetical protein XH93_00775 [Bradyrhizobium sp. CCBAU 51753]